jgi:hypothetical protein
MPTDTTGDLGARFQARMEALVTALTGGDGSPFDDPLDDSDEEREGEVDIEPPRGATQEAVEAAVRRVENEESDSRHETDDRIVA